MKPSETEEGFTPLMNQDEYDEAAEYHCKQGIRPHEGARGRLTYIGSGNLKLIAAAGLGALGTLAVLALFLVWKINSGLYFGSHDCRLGSDAYFGDSELSRPNSERRCLRQTDLTDTRSQFPGRQSISRRMSYLRKVILASVKMAVLYGAKSDQVSNLCGPHLIPVFTPLNLDNHAATMVAVSKPARFGLHGGGKMWENPDDFDDDTEAYSVSVMHQIHCLVRDYGTPCRKIVAPNAELPRLSRATSSSTFTTRAAACPCPTTSWGISPIVPRSCAWP